MIATVAVGTDGSGTAAKAVRAGIDLAERYGARIVFMSAYSPVDESRLRHEKRDAPDEVQWTINPEKDVDATLRECEELAEERAQLGHPQGQLHGLPRQDDLSRRFAPQRRSGYGRPRHLRRGDQGCWRLS